VRTIGTHLSRKWSPICREGGKTVKEAVSLKKPSFVFNRGKGGKGIRPSRSINRESRREKKPAVLAKKYIDGKKERRLVLNIREGGGGGRGTLIENYL